MKGIKPKKAPKYPDIYQYPDNKPNFCLMENKITEPLTSTKTRLPHKTCTPQYNKYPGSPEQMKRLIFPQKIKIKPYG